MDLAFHAKNPCRREVFRVCNGRREPLKVDEISEFPDDILVHVLSYLTMKEAGMTSVLSKRWIHVWEYVPTLNFDSHKVVLDITLGEKSVDQETRKYVGWVDKVVSLHKASTIDEFNVRFDLTEDKNGHRIDNWFRFAIEKRVKRLQVDFSGWSGCYSSLYSFPSSLCSSSLISLELTHVNVTGEALEKLLYNCQNLERLSVEWSESLVDLRVAGPSLKLKYLALYHCRKINHLEIAAPNLVYCKYYGFNISVPFKSNPKLNELFIGGEYGMHMTNNFMQHFSYLSQLEGLELHLPCELEYTLKSVQFPIFTKLTKLSVSVSPVDDENLMRLRRLIKACPCLHKFVLQMHLNDVELRKKMSKKRKAHLNPNLKIVELTGFVGNITDLEFAMYLMEIAGPLEKIIVNPRYPLQEFCESKRISRARKKSKLLHACLKPGADLVIF